MRDDTLPVHAYGGILTYYEDMEVGTKFHVLNGHWDGEIIEENGVKRAKVLCTGMVMDLDDHSFAWTKGGPNKRINLDHNKFAKEHHAKIVSLGYWQVERAIGTLLMLMVTELSKLFDPGKLNRPEKLADLALRIYDYCGRYNINLDELPEVSECDLWSMLAELTNEMEAFRADIESSGRYTKNCLAMVYKYANENNIDLERELLSKSAILDKIKRKLK